MSRPLVAAIVGVASLIAFMAGLVVGVLLEWDDPPAEHKVQPRRKADGDYVAPKSGKLSGMSEAIATQAPTQWWTQWSPTITPRWDA